MLRFARWLSYRDRTLAHLTALLLAYPRNRRVTKDFPFVSSVLREHFQDGVPPASAALQLAGRIISDLVRQLGAEQRGMATQGVLAKGADAIRELTVGRIGRRPDEAQDPVRFATELVAVAIFLARRMTEEGDLGRGEFAWFLGELDAALGAGVAGPGEALSRRFALAEHGAASRR